MFRRSVAGALCSLIIGCSSPQKVEPKIVITPRDPVKEAREYCEDIDSMGLRERIYNLVIFEGDLLNPLENCPIYGLSKKSIMTNDSVSALSRESFDGCSMQWGTNIVKDMLAVKYWQGKTNLGVILHYNSFKEGMVQLLIAVRNPNYSSRGQPLLAIPCEKALSTNRCDFLKTNETFLLRQACEKLAYAP